MFDILVLNFCIRTSEIPSAVADLNRGCNVVSIEDIASSTDAMAGSISSRSFNSGWAIVLSEYTAMR